MEKDMDKITKKVEKQVKKIRKNDDVEKGIVALANRVRINCRVLAWWRRLTKHKHFFPGTVGQGGGALSKDNPITPTL